MAVSKLLRLDQVQTAHAIGIAATQVTGLREMFGSHTKSLHPGRASQNGLLAALLASNGYTSSTNALEAKRGWANVVGATKKDLPESLDEWLGTSRNGLVQGSGSEMMGRWEILRNSFKPFPCGIVCHPVIDGCIQLHQELQAKGQSCKDIEIVHAQVHPLVLELTAKRAPKDGLEGKFSVFHGGAVGLVYGRAAPSQYTDETVQDSEVINIRDRIQAEAEPALQADETQIQLTLRDGSKLSKHVQHAVGSLHVPMTDEQLEAKFKDQCAAILGDDLERVSQACWQIGSSPDVAEIVQLM